MKGAVLAGRVLRSPGAEFVVRDVPTALRGQVLGLRGYRVERTGPRGRLILPDCAVKLVLGFAGPARVVDAVDPRRAVTAVSLVNPARSTACIGECDGLLHAITVRLAPSAAYRILGIPLDLMAGQPVDLAEVAGPAGRALAERLAALPGWDARFAALEQWLALRLEAAPAGSAEVLAAWDLLTREAGAVSVGALASVTGWSSRRLERRFAQQVGLAPKAAAGVLRLRRAMRLQAGGLCWADAAACAGYYDQPHFNHAFTAMVGRSPEWFRAAQAVADPRDARTFIAGRHASVLLDRSH